MSCFNQVFAVDFQISPIDIKEISHLFGQDHDSLSKLGVQRIVADCDPGYPCRVSLQDAKVGENLLLMNYEHQPIPTPFRSSHAIYVREAAITARLRKNKVPEALRHRFLSVRAFDVDGIIIDADLTEGESLETSISKMFANDCVDYLHIHNAKLGCYLALAERC